MNILLLIHLLHTEVLCLLVVNLVIKMKYLKVIRLMMKKRKKEGNELEDRIRELEGENTYLKSKMQS